MLQSHPLPPTATVILSPPYALALAGVLYIHLFPAMCLQINIGAFSASPFSSPRAVIPPSLLCSSAPPLVLPTPLWPQKPTIELCLEWGWGGSLVMDPVHSVKVWDRRLPTTGWGLGWEQRSSQCVEKGSY